MATSLYEYIVQADQLRMNPFQFLYNDKALMQKDVACKTGNITYHNYFIDLDDF